MEIGALRKEPSTGRGGREGVSGWDNDSCVTSEEVSAPKLLCWLIVTGADRGGQRQEVDGGKRK